MTATARLARVGITARNWAGLADWIRQHYCWERQRTGQCGHKACNHAANLEQSALALDMGQPSDHDTADFDKFVRRKQCHAPHGCNHKGCAQAEGVREWLAEQDQKEAA